MGLLDLFYKFFREKPLVSNAADSKLVEEATKSFQTDTLASLNKHYLYFGLSASAAFLNRIIWSLELTGGNGVNFQLGIALGSTIVSFAVVKCCPKQRIRPIE